jgi:hypothetical protein
VELQPSGVGSALTEQYDGISWVTAPSLATARYHISASAGTQTAGLAIGFAPGYTPSVVASHRRIYRGNHSN